MKKPRSRWRDPRFVFSVGIALIIIAVYTISLISPGSNTVVTATLDTTISPTSTPRPTQVTVPTPEPDGPLLIASEPQIQNNGLFQVIVPQGYFAQRNEYDPSIPRVRISYTNPARLSVIDVLLQFGVNYTSLQDLSDEFFTDNYFFSSWQEYDGFTETNRTVGDRVSIDFDLVAGEVNYLARQVAWLDQDWLLMVRVIVPANNPALLDASLDMIEPNFVAYEDQRNAEPAWNAYYDQQQGYLVRHSLWRTVSGSEGTPSVLEDPLTSARMVLRSFENTPLASLDEAETYVSGSLRPGSTVLASQVTARQFGGGYLVSYSDVDNEGDPISGLAALLNDASGKLLVADIRLPKGDIDLLSVGDDPDVQQLRHVIDTFMVLPPLGYQPTITAAPPPEASPEPTQEATSDSSG